MSDESIDLEGLGAEPDRLRDVPVPLDLIGEPWESQWREAVRQLQAQGSWRSVDAPLLEACIKARRQAAELEVDARAEPIVVGSTGQPVLNPAHAAVIRYHELAAKLARMLKLAPIARDGGTADPEALRDTGKAGDDDQGDELDGLEDELKAHRDKKAAGGR